MRRELSTYDRLPSRRDVLGPSIMLYLAESSRGVDTPIHQCCRTGNVTSHEVADNSVSYTASRNKPTNCPPNFPPNNAPNQQKHTYRCDQYSSNH
mmetsp:Transcript_5117/g.11237  ORF Transcript_5117/g.11237 Transcript_5117/m.11237 type:complete len:95 (-) Transcript_5117:146-430(-)